MAPTVELAASAPKLKTSKSYNLLDVPKEAPCLRKSFSCVSLPVPSNFSFASMDIGVSEERWLILALYVALSALSSVHWIQYSVIANIITRYYGVSELSVDWTAMVFAVAYVVLVLPVTRFIDEKGLRAAALVGAIGTAVGSWVKVLSASPHGFPVALLGQVLLGVSQVFVHSMPSKVGAVWFPPEQVGVAIGFLLTPLIVQNHQNSDLVGRELTVMFIGLAVITSALTVFVWKTFKAAPQRPPSHAQAVQRSIATSSSGCHNGESHKLGVSIQASCLHRLFRRNNGFLLILLAFGVNAGVCSAVSTLLNQLLLNYYPESTLDAGILGTIMVMSRAVMGPLYGRALDTTRCYSGVTVSVSALSALAMCAFVASLISGSMRLVYVAGGFLGMFLCGFPAVASELASELTFPEPEGVVTGIINAVTQVFGIVLTLCMVHVQTLAGDLVANVSCCVLLLLATIVTALSGYSAELKRQSAREGLAYAAAIECEGAREFTKLYTGPYPLSVPHAADDALGRFDDIDEGIYV